MDDSPSKTGGVVDVYIYGPSDGSEAAYLLVTEQGEIVAKHCCSNWWFAPGDLWLRRMERRHELAQRLGGVTPYWPADNRGPGLPAGKLTCSELLDAYFDYESRQSMLAS